MTLVCVEVKLDSWGRFLQLECNQCHTRFQKHYQAYILNKKHHFCCRKCTNLAKKKHGILNVSFEGTCKEKYGVCNPFQVKEVKEKCIQTLNRHFAEKDQNYSNPSQVPQLRDKIKQTCVNRFGVDNPNKNKLVRSKTVETLKSKYGVTNAFTLVHKRGQFVTPFSKQSTREKALDTRLQNSSVRVSKMEQSFFDRVRSWGYAVKQQVRLSKWPIDALINGVYIQYDGIHHHGLQEQSKKYTSVIKQMSRDQEQIVWCKKNNKALLRLSSFVADKLTHTQFNTLLSATLVCGVLTWPSVEFTLSVNERVLLS